MIVLSTPKKKMIVLSEQILTFGYQWFDNMFISGDNPHLTCRFCEVVLGLGAEPPPASLGTSPSSASTFFVASPTITRTSRFSCGIWYKFRRKHVSCGFCQGFSFSGKCNTFVGNCFLRILGSAGNVQLSVGRK